jgi:hypothetical protein
VNLRKWCKSIHLPDRIKTLRLGSLLEYRVTEEKSIKDFREGKFDLEVRIPKPIWVRADQFSGFFPSYSNSKFPPYFSWDPRGLHSSSSVNYQIHGDRILLSGGGSQSWMFPNSYVFSMTMSDSLQSKFPQYDASWGIDFHDADTFSDLLRQQLQKEVFVNEEVLGQCLSENYDRTKLTVSVLHAPVEYGPNFVELNDLGPEGYEKMFSAYWRMPFTKPIDFEHEEEYRFLVTILYEGTPLPIYSLSRTISSERFLGLIKQA